jgi:hypothetical protein
MCDILHSIFSELTTKVLLFSCEAIYDWMGQWDTLLTMNMMKGQA